MDELIELIIRGLISLFSQQRPNQDQARRAPLDTSSQPGAPPPGYSAQNPPQLAGRNSPTQQQRDSDEADNFVLPAQRMLTPQQTQQAAQQQQDQHSLERMSPQQRLEIARQALLQRAQQQRAKQQQIEREEELAQRMRDPRFSGKAKQEMQRMQQAIAARQQQAALAARQQQQAAKQSAIQQAARQAATAQAARQGQAVARAAAPQTLKQAAQPAPVKFEALSVVSAKSHSSEFGKSSAGAKIADLLHANPAAVRQMFVLAEILQPPLALREGGNQRY